jgi:hypothetical protein
MFETDRFGNVSRMCVLRGHGRGLWRVQTAVKGGRYLVRNVDTKQCRVVPHGAMTSLY